MRIALLSHGYPPRETAGTEQYTQRLAEGLRARGHVVRVFVAAPRAGARVSAVEDDGFVWRLAQNAPYAPLREAGRDRGVETLLGRALEGFRPEVIHVQHLQNLSAGLELPAPYLWTLHDAWAWCAAGGLLLREGTPCTGPSAACAPCASGWVRDPPRVAKALSLAGRLSRWIPQENLQDLWRALPAAARSRFVGAPAAPVTARQLLARDAAIQAFARRAAGLVSPSVWLAEAAAKQGLPRPEVIPHGVDAAPLQRNPDGPFVFLGTLAPHKGPDRVVRAHARAGVTRPLALYGPPGPDPDFAARFPGARALPQVEVRRVLAGARALVLGSRWPENAPLVILEARAQGCPVIAPALGGIPELLVDGVDGRLVPPDDEEALMGAIRALDAAPLDTVRAPPAFGVHLDAVEARLRRAADPRRGG
jgi:glycosyltransferase involved in cell wall biosynthesis